MNEFHFIGFDVHKKSIYFCAKTADGRVVEHGRLASTHQALEQWIARQTKPWKGALEATMFSAWIYDALAPHAAELKVAHSAQLKAIAAGKHASDRLDASTIADLVRVNWIPGVWMAPPEIRALRLHMRYRNLVVRQATQVKNRIASTLMEYGVEYSRSKLHQKGYFRHLLDNLERVPEPVRELLRHNRGCLETFQSIQQLLVKRLNLNPLLAQRLELLQTIPGVGQITALTWALEVGDPHRFPSAGRAMSYCGLVAPLQESAGKHYRQPLSKKRNAHLQTILIEAAHLAPRFHPQLRVLYDRVKEHNHTGAAVLAVARKLVCYLLAVDKSQTPFQLRTESNAAQPGTAQPNAPDPPTGKGAFPPEPPIETAKVARQSSPSRVRSAAAKTAAPRTAPGCRAVGQTAMGGSGGKAAPQSNQSSGSRN